MILFIPIIILIQLCVWIVFAHIILSWLPLLGIQVQVKFINDIIDPIYEKIEQVIPTAIGGISFTPIVFIVLLMFIKGFLYTIFPTLAYLVPDIFR